VDEVFSIKALEKKPGLKVKLALEEGHPTRLGVHRPGLTEAERQKVKSLLEAFAHTISSEGLDVKVLFLDHDSHCTGCIVKTNFIRAAFPLFRGDAHKDGVLLAKAYEMPETGFINYKRLLQDLQGLQDSKHPYSAPLGLSHPRLSPTEANRIRGMLARLASSGTTIPASLCEAFQQHDYNAFGMVSKHELLKASLPHKIAISFYSSNKSPPSHYPLKSHIKALMASCISLQ